ncbi:hypothetical protein CMI37_01665 [Candidatus Pacearchaeota archaeon]|nr:hypothetical protein [Candidatus Pacearchaeota archaeon]|tara:strand:- start:1102 stop:1614 length:513 start_codon:yes stop_codon:yes gene_type:complete
MPDPRTKEMRKLEGGGHIQTPTAPMMGGLLGGGMPLFGVGDFEGMIRGQREVNRQRIRDQRSEARALGHEQNRPQEQAEERKTFPRFQDKTGPWSQQALDFWPNLREHRIYSAPGPGTTPFPQRPEWQGPGPAPGPWPAFKPGVPGVVPPRPLRPGELPFGPDGRPLVPG